MDRARPVVGAKSTPLRPRLRRGLRSVPLPLLSPQNLRILWGPRLLFGATKKRKWGESGAAPPVADAASRFRGCGTIGGPGRGRESSRRDGAAMNQPASWLAFPRPSGQVQTFPLRGKSNILLSEKKPFPCGEKGIPPRRGNPFPVRGNKKAPLMGSPLPSLRKQTLTAYSPGQPPF